VVSEALLSPEAEHTEDRSDDPVAVPRPGAIPIAGPWITQREVDAVARAARGSWFEDATVESRAFEQEFAAATDRQFAIALPSCTAALHLALLAHGIGPGDDVIVPEATWIASAAPIVHVGATPVFADVDPTTWCLSVEEVRRLVSPRTRAVIAVDLYGGFPDLVALETLCAERGLVLIEDAAEAAGGRHARRAAGSFGDVSCFSFHGSKTLTTGEGGMVLCDDETVNARMLFLRDHGRLPGDVSYRSVEVAWKYKMSELQAALGRVQLARIEQLIARKRTIFAWYAERLAGCGVRLNVERPGDEVTYWMVTAVFEPATGVTVAAARDALAEASIPMRPFFPPLSDLPAFADADDVPRARQENVRAYDLARRSINLPSALTLGEADVDRVCEVVRRLSS
jgi:perosamine synthetase